MDPRELSKILEAHRRYLFDLKDGVRANLRGANLEKETLDRYFPQCCPDTGEFIGWKKVWIVIPDEHSVCRRIGTAIVKLQITENAKRSSAFGRKCRCSEAMVLDIIPNKEAIKSLSEVALMRFCSSQDIHFEYRLGDIVKVDDFDEDRTHECAPGIHFFITRKEAEDYVLC